MTLIPVTKNTTLQVSIVIPVRNRPDVLEKCLSSLAEQNFPLSEFEVFVCDDGSDDYLDLAVYKFIERIPNIRILRHLKPKGPAAARNMGFRSANADIFVCLDSDVVCSPNFLREITQALKANPDWVAVEASVIPTGGSGSPLWDAPVNIKGGIFLTAASAYRSKAIRRAGGFDESFPYAACEDTDLAARLLTFGTYGFSPRAIVYHPRRRVTLRTHWKWIQHWKYVTVLAKRYGFLGFPGRSATRYPRLRVALSAVVCLPAKRFIEAIKYIRCNSSESMLAISYSIFDVFCGIWALPSIAFFRVLPFQNYISSHEEDTYS